MPPRKRKTAAGDASEEPPAKKSQKGTKATPSTRPARASTRSKPPATYAEEDHDDAEDLESESPAPAAPKAKKPSASKRSTKKPSKPVFDAPKPSPSPYSPSKPSKDAALTSPSTRNYWLMKAEPTTRLENGHDVKFSIDDLAARTRPEPWDGIRNHVAKNNLLAMKRGDLAFFYHSNCKVPGIVGVMEIVQEASPDETAWDSKSAYYDAKSGPDKRTWYLVHVEFRRKFKDIVGLKELQGYKGNGQALEGMQLLKQSRLSVSKVAEKEWEFIMGLAEGKEAE